MMPFGHSLIPHSAHYSSRKPNKQVNKASRKKNSIERQRTLRELKIVIAPPFHPCRIMNRFSGNMLAAENVVPVA
jgi:hypothetical protein